MPHLMRVIRSWTKNLQAWWGVIPGYRCYLNLRKACSSNFFCWKLDAFLHFTAQPWRVSSTFIYRQLLYWALPCRITSCWGDLEMLRAWLCPWIYFGMHQPWPLIFTRKDFHPKNVVSAASSLCLCSITWDRMWRMEPVRVRNWL